MKKDTEKTLVLSKDVWNPKSDLRYKRDWRKRELFEQGTKFLVISEFWERTHEKELLETAKSVAAKLAALGEEVPAETALEIKSLQRLVDSGPREIVLIQLRGTNRYGDRVSKYADSELFDALMDGLQDAPKDLKDVLGDYSSPDWGGGPAAVLQQLVDNGTLNFKQIERAVAELDPDHTVLDSIVMAVDEVDE